MAKKIKVYSTPSCIFCHMAKEFFRENRISFENIDVSQAIDGAREMFDKSGQMGVPVIDINGEIVVGFDQKKIEELIND